MVAVMWQCRKLAGEACTFEEIQQMHIYKHNEFVFNGFINNLFHSGSCCSGHNYSCYHQRCWSCRVVADVLLIVLVMVVLLHNDCKIC